MGTSNIQTPMQVAQKPLPPEVYQARHCQRCGRLMFLKPVIQCGHCGSILPLRCFSYGKNGAFYAECIDLNLLARGNTREEAVVRLQEQMFSYVATVFAGEGTRGLIPRSAPLTSLFRYYFSALVDSICRRHHPHHFVDDLQNVGTKMLSHC